MHRIPFPPLAAAPSPLAPLAFVRRSFERFLQADVSPEERENVGLQAALRSVFSIFTEDRTAELVFCSYQLDAPVEGPLEAMRLGTTFAAPLRITVQLIYYEAGAEGEQKIYDILEQQIYFGHLPLMTERGTFVVEGVERVLLPRLRPVPGWSVDRARGEARAYDAHGNAAVVRPERDGSFTGFFEPGPGTPPEALLRTPPEVHSLAVTSKGLELTLSSLPSRALKAQQALVDRAGRQVVAEGRPLTAAAFRKLQGKKGVTLLVSERDALRLRLAQATPSPDGTRTMRAGERLDVELLRASPDRKRPTAFPVVFHDERPGLPAPVRHRTIEEVARWFWVRADDFDIGKESEARLSARLGRECYALGEEAIAAAVADLREGPGHGEEQPAVRVWAAGESMARAVRVGMREVAGNAQDRLSWRVDGVMPHDLFSARPLVSALRDLFLSDEHAALADDRTPLTLLQQHRTLRRDDGSLFVLPVGCVPGPEGEILPAEGGPHLPIAEALVPFHEARPAEAPPGPAAPLLTCLLPLDPAPPRVGTGAEADVAEATGDLAIAREAGEVLEVAGHLAVAPSEPPGIPVIYPVRSLPQSNHGGPARGRAVVGAGQRVEPGQVLAGGAGTAQGELALGHDLLVAFAGEGPGVTVSAAAIEAGKFATSRLRIVECAARETRRGREQITADNAGYAPLLDESGIVKTGSLVRPGDILVGRAILPGGLDDAPAKPDSDASDDEVGGPLVAGPEDSGVVVWVDVLRRKGAEASRRQTEIVDERLRAYRELPALAAERSLAELRRVVAARVVGRTMTMKLVDDQGAVLVRKGETITPELVATLPGKYLGEFAECASEEEWAWRLFREAGYALEECQARCQDSLDRGPRGSDLQRGVITLVRVAIESTRPLAEGDLLADRHGFVAPITRIAADWEMPKLPDGRMLDAVLPAAAGPSPGAMTELRLGLAALALGEWLAVPQGTIPEEAIQAYCERAGVSPAGQARLEAVWGVPATEVPVGLLYLVRMAPAQPGEPSTAATDAAWSAAIR